MTGQASTDNSALFQVPSHASSTTSLIPLPSGTGKVSSVRVALRVRPLSAKEQLAGCTECLSCLSNEPQVIIGTDRAFTFDMVFNPEAAQRQIFEAAVKPLLEQWLTGYNCTILAYGQTGSGKTHTIGTGLNSNLDEESQGIIPRAVDALFASLAKRPPISTSTSNSGSTSTASDMMISNSGWAVTASFLEVYNEDIIDLLNPQLGKTDKKPNVSIREDVHGEIYLAGLREEPVPNAKSVLNVLQRGLLSRTTASTDMNLASSRSHAIFTLSLRQRLNSGSSVSDNELDAAGSTHITSKFHFVDLAGSERLKRTNAVGDRAKESISINGGLLALGNVISALGDEQRKAAHIPYRDSKLTRLLQDSLGGNSNTLMIACISPADTSFMETLNTLKYANRARNIKNRVQINHDMNGSNQAELAQLKKQIQMLKQENDVLKRHGSQIPPDSPADDFVHDAQRNRIQLLETDISQLNLAVMQQQQKINVLTSEIVQTNADRDSLKLLIQNKDGSDLAGKRAELKQAVQPLIEEYVKTVMELKSRLALAEATPLFQPLQQQLQSPTTSSFSVVPRSSLDRGSSNAIQETLVQAKTEIRKNVALLNMHVRPVHKRIREILLERDSEILSERRLMTALKQDPQLRKELDSSKFGSLVSKDDYDAAFDKLSDDIQNKETLIRRLEDNQMEYSAMKTKYEQKMKLLQESLLSAQKDRDEALKQMPQNEDADKGPKLKYEDKIKRLMHEVNELRKKQMENNKMLRAKAQSSDALIQNLKASIQSMKQEKARLLLRMKEESARQKTQELARDNEIRLLRKKETKANETAKKLQRDVEQHKVLLKRRAEESLFAKNKLKYIMSLIRNNKTIMSSIRQDVYETAASRLGMNDEELSQIPNQRDDELNSTQSPISPSAPLAQQDWQQNIQFRKSLLDKEIDLCVNNRETSGVMDELLKKRENLVHERSLLEAEKQKLATYLAERVDASPAEYTRLNEVEERLEIVDAEVRYLSNARLRGVQEDAANNWSQSSGTHIESIVQMLHSVSSDERNSLLALIVEDMVQLRVREKSLKMTEGSLHQTLADLRHTLQLMRKAAVDSAVEHEETILHLKKMHQAELAEFESRLREEMNQANSMPPVYPKSQDRGRLSNRRSSSADRSKQSSQGDLQDALAETTTLSQSSSSSSVDLQRSSSQQRVALVKPKVKLQKHGADAKSLTEHMSSTSLNPSSPIRDDQGPIAFERLASVTAHNGAIYAVVAHRNYIYTASQDGTVKVWDAAQWKEVHVLPNHLGFVRALACHGGLLFTASQSGIRIWDVSNSWKMIQQLAPHADDVHTLAVNKIGTLLFAGLGDGTVAVWDLVQFKPVATLTGHKGTVFALALAFDDSRLFTGARDHSIRCFDTKTFTCELLLRPPHYDVVQALTVVNGDTLYSASRDYSIKQWDIHDFTNVEATQRSMPQPLTLLSAHKDWILSLQTIDSQRFISGSRDGIVKLWSLDKTVEKSSNEPPVMAVAEQLLHEGAIHDMDLLESAQKLVTVSSDRTLRLWRFTNGF